MIARTSYNTRRQSIALKEYYSAHLGTLPPCGEARAEGGAPKHCSNIVYYCFALYYREILIFEGAFAPPTVNLASPVLPPRDCTLNWDELLIQQHDLSDLENDLTEEEIRAAVMQTPPAPSGYI
jgi:hypothetical protein